MRISFFFVTSVIMTIIVLIGFSPSFLLRPYFSDTQLPIALIIHGTINLFWFFGLIYQSSLIARNKVINHRKFGYYIFGWVVLMIIMNLYIIYLTALRFHAGEIPLQAASGLTLGNFIGLIPSTIIIVFAYITRNRAAYHKRLIFIFSIGLISFATDRIGRNILPLTENIMVNGLLMSFIVQNTFYAALIVYDIKKIRKPHIITIIGILLPFVVILFTLFLLQNGFGEKFLFLFK